MFVYLLIICGIARVLLSMNIPIKQTIWWFAFVIRVLTVPCRAVARPSCLVYYWTEDNICWLSWVLFTQIQRCLIEIRELNESVINSLLNKTQYGNVCTVWIKVDFEILIRKLKKLNLSKSSLKDPHQLFIEPSSVRLDQRHTFSAPYCDKRCSARKYSRSGSNF